jgi:dolichol-phosphate mannosyltransferase
MISVVVPARDEAENLGQLVREIHAALNQFAHEIVIVDDGSTDDTAVALREMQRADPQLRALRHRFPCGQSAALRSGIHAARHPWIATLDGDGQNDPADLPRLWDARPPDLRPEQPWLAIGHRMHRCDTRWRRFSSRFANRLRAWWLEDATPDTGCGSKLFGRAMYLDLPWFDHQHRYFPALVRRAGGVTVSVPVNHRPRAHGRTKYGTWGRAWVGVVDMLGVKWLQRRNRLPQVEEIA